MKALLIKELKSVFCSLSGAFFAFVFLLIQGLILWVFPGRYNIIDGGYANLSSFFSLSALLFAFLIPSLTMRLFSEEKRRKTLDILFSRPVYHWEIYFSKFLSTFLFIFLVVLSSLIYLYSLYQLANPIGNIDFSSIVTSYFSLYFLILLYISVGLFGSCITKNQIVAFIVSVFLNIVLYYGFELLSEMVLSGKTKILISDFGLYTHYEHMQKGVVNSYSLFLLFTYILFFIVLTLYLLNRRNVLKYISFFMIGILINATLFLILPPRLDFTSQKRYTLSEYSINTLKHINPNTQLKINIFLDGKLNYGFQYLRNETDALLSDMNHYSDGSIYIRHVNPYTLSDDRNEVYNIMVENGMDGVQLNEIDREGKASQKVIYPYAQITNGTDTLVINLLKNIRENTADQNFNASVESLEFEFIDAIRLLNQSTIKHIAFIEGHEELSRAYIYDAEIQLSKYYFINRGQISGTLGELDDFKAIVIAGPLKKYSEEEKYVIDQYIMNGGKVLWLIDGASFSHEDLVKKGYSPSIKNDVNLDDMLFTYGVRINSDLIQDQQCVSHYVLASNSIQSSVLYPNYFQPLLIPSNNNSITKNIRDIKAGFASSLSIVNTSDKINKTILLTTSSHTHLLKVPEMIDFNILINQENKNYFNQSYVPVAVSFEGTFNSVFTNRMIPPKVNDKGNKITQFSKKTRMIVASSSEIISNEIQGKGENTEILPMGYDKVTKQLFGNRDFIVNSLNWLTGDDELMNLRSKDQKMYLLNKQKTYEQRDKFSIINTVFPLLFIYTIMGVAYVCRKRKYG